MVDLFRKRSKKHKFLTARALEALVKEEEELAKKFSQRHPHIPLTTFTPGEETSVLNTASFAQTQARPKSIKPTTNPTITYVPTNLYQQREEGQQKISDLQMFVRIEDPLSFNGKQETVETLRHKKDLRNQYFEKVFTHMNAQSYANGELIETLNDLLLPEEGRNDFDLSAAMNFFDNRVNEGKDTSEINQKKLQEILEEFDFTTQTPEQGPIALRLSLSPHEQTDGTHLQSLATVFLGTKNGIAYRKKNGEVTFLQPEAFEKQYQKFIQQLAQQKIAAIREGPKRTTTQAKVWGEPGECREYLEKHDAFLMRGLEWTLEQDDKGNRVLGSHENVAAYVSGDNRVAVKAIPFESVNDLVHLIQTHQYVHDIQSATLGKQARVHPETRKEILSSTIDILGETTNKHFEDAKNAWDALQRIEQDDFDRNIGPLIHQVSVDYENKMLVTVSDWNEEGMLSEDQAKKRLVNDCSLSYRLRMAANIFKNGSNMLKDDVTHTDLKPENILNRANGTFKIQQTIRKNGLDSLTTNELKRWKVGEKLIEGDVSGMYFGRKGAVDNVSSGESLPATHNYSHWRFAAFGCTPGITPSGFEERSNKNYTIDEVILLQDVANRGVTAWEIIYGSLNDCIPPQEEQERTRKIYEAEDNLQKAILEAKESGRVDSRALRSALYDRDRAVTNRVSLRSETIEKGTQYTPLIQQARDNNHGTAVWVDTKVVDVLSRLANDFSNDSLTKKEVKDLYKQAEFLLKAEANKLERADTEVAKERRVATIRYMNRQDLSFNPACGLFGAEDLTNTYDKIDALVEQMPDPKLAIEKIGTEYKRFSEHNEGIVELLKTVTEEQKDTMQQNTTLSARSGLRELSYAALLQEHKRKAVKETSAHRITPGHLQLVEKRVPVLQERDGKLVPTYVSQ